MFYIKYYMKELNTYFKKFKVSIKTFLIVTGRDSGLVIISKGYFYLSYYVKGCGSYE